MWAFYGNCQPLKFSNGGTGLMVGAGKDGGADHLNVEWGNEMEC